MWTLAAGQLDASDLTHLFVVLGILLGAARLMGEIARRLGQPAVLGEIIAGVLLGPTLLGRLWPDGFGWLFRSHGDSQLVLEGFTTIAVALLMLVAGLEVELSSIRRQGRATLLVSCTGMVFPFALGFLVAWFFPRLLGHQDDSSLLTFALFLGIAMAITALPVIAKILLDLNMLKSDMGMLILSSAMVNDLLGWMGFAVVLALMNPHQDGAAAGVIGLGGTLSMTLIFMLGMITVGRWTIHYALPRMQAHLSWPGGVLGFILVTALLCGALTEWIGIHAIFGCFMAGVAIGDSTHLRERTRETLNQFITNIFAPVFFACIGLKVDFVANFDLTVVAVVLVVACVAKIGGCYLGARWAAMPRRESLAVGFAMSARGAMEIVLGQLALAAGIINEPMFVALVIMALVTSLISAPAIQLMLRSQHIPRIPDLVPDPRYVVELQGQTDRDVIDELTTRAGQLANRDSVSLFSAVWKREKIGRTGIGQELALPHARLEDLPRPVLVIGRSRAGIDFDAADGSKAHIICLLLTPEDDQTTQVHLLAQLTYLFGDEQIRERFREADSTLELFTTIRLAQLPPHLIRKDRPADDPPADTVTQGK